MDVLWEWVNINYQWLVSTLLSVIIAYHVYYLSKRVTLKDKLEHKEIIKSKTDNLISKIVREGLRRKVLLVNINWYFKDYPSNTEKIGGYSVIAGEIKATRYDGVEFFCDMPKSIYEREDGKITFLIRRKILRNVE